MRDVPFDECFLHAPHSHAAIILGDPRRHLVRHRGHLLTLGIVGKPAADDPPVRASFRWRVLQVRTFAFGGGDRRSHHGALLLDDSSLVDHGPVTLLVAADTLSAFLACRSLLTVFMQGEHAAHAWMASKALGRSLRARKPWIAWPTRNLGR